MCAIDLAEIKKFYSKKILLVLIFQYIHILPLTTGDHWWLRGSSEVEALAPTQDTGGLSRTSPNLRGISASGGARQLIQPEMQES
jgi:hypothetical protein